MIMGKTGCSRAADNLQSAQEADLIAQIVSLTRAKLLAGYTPGGGPMHRDAHPKSHGCVRAKFIVASKLPDYLRVGLFAEAGTFDAWIRYSNGAPSQAPDSRPDVRGMAIKVMGVPGTKLLEDELQATTQDFVVCNHHSFFVKDPADYVSFVSNFMNGKPLGFIFPELNPLKWRLREVWNLANGLLKSIPSTTEIRYWSQTPYRFGYTAVKYSVVPRSVPTVPAQPKSDNRLREALIAQLAAGEVVLDFMVQLQESPRTMPIEDPRIRWSETESPFIKVATIVIPAQEFDTAERREFDENLSFTPWHALPEHEPLGGINRARRAVYQAISRLRHETNGVARVEPTA
jgi:Catalase